MRAAWTRFQVALAVWLGAWPAGADPAQVDDLVRQGIDLRRGARDAEALAVFRRAYRLHPTPRVRAQMGLAEEAVSDWLDAEQDIAAAAAERDPWIDRNANALGAALRDVEGHLASLDLRANVEGAELWVDGTVRATLPLTAPLRVIAGSRDILVRAAGFESMEQVVVLPPGSALRQTLSLHPIASLARDPPGNDRVAPLPSPGPTMSPSLSWGAESRSTTARPLAWALLGTAGVLVAGGATASVLSRANAAVYKDDGRCLFGDLTRDQRCGGYRDRAEATSALAVVGYALGAAAGIASAVVFVLAAKHRTNGAHLSCSFLDIGLGCDGRF